MTSELGKFGKFTLLTGAGWSRNWGAPLAADVWQMIMDDAGVRANRELLGLLRDEPSFEVALAKARVSPFAAADRETLERAVLDAFVRIDQEIARIDPHARPNIYLLQQLLFRFARRDESIDTGYLFTLNQDLFCERHLYNEHVSRAPGASLPGVEGLGQPLQLFNSVAECARARHASGVGAR